MILHNTRRARIVFKAQRSTRVRAYAARPSTFTYHERSKCPALLTLQGALCKGFRLVEVVL